MGLDFYFNFLYKFNLILNWSVYYSSSCLAEDILKLFDDFLSQP